MSFLAPLEIDGVTIADFALRGGAYEQHVDEGIMLQLEIGHPGMRTRTPLVRLDWRPLSPSHKNPDRTIIFGDHIHPFGANWLETERRMRRGNLPVAEALPTNPTTFGELLDLGRGLLRVSNLDTVPSPEWSPKLL